MITLNSYIYLIKCKISACQWRQTDTVIKRKHEKNIKSLCSKPPRWNVNRGLHQMKRCEACLWRAIQDNKKYQEKKSRCYPLPWKRRVISTECCSEKSGEEEGAWFCLCGMLACFQEMGNERRMRRTWSSLRAAGFRCPCRPERGGGANFHCLIWLRNHQLAFLEERSGQIFSLLLYPAPPHPLLPSFPEASLHVYTETASGKLGSAVDLAHAAYSPPCTTDVSVHLLVTWRSVSLMWFLTKRERDFVSQRWISKAEPPKSAHSLGWLCWLFKAWVMFDI